MGLKEHRFVIPIVAVFVVVSLLGLFAVLVPVKNCPVCESGINRKESLSSPWIFCLCEDGRVSYVHWWKLKRELESRRGISPW